MQVAAPAFRLIDPTSQIVTRLRDGEDCVRGKARSAGN